MKANGDELRFGYNRGYQIWMVPLNSAGVLMDPVDERMVTV